MKATVFFRMIVLAAMAVIGITNAELKAQEENFVTNEIKDGDLVITNANDGYCIAGYGASYAIQADLGSLDVEGMDPAERLIFCKTTLVTNDNVDDIISKFIETQDPGYDYSDLSFCIDKYQEDSAADEATDAAE